MICWIKTFNKSRTYTFGFFIKPLLVGFELKPRLTIQDLLYSTLDKHTNRNL